ncbi:hypothetical protein H6785_04125 [Candidatus Nomurabacteria bacterium]|nr:hypothetical protein [Candidatus Nomurabacteria bacterium]
MTKEKSLYIDFDGTLTNDRYWRSLPTDKHTKIQNLLFGENRPMVGDWMRGKYTAEEINKYASEKIDVPYEELWEVFVADCKSIKVEQSLLESIDRLRSKYVVVLMTGNMDSFTRFTVPSLKLENYFDYISNSYYEKIHKTDNGGELFTIWSNKLRIPLSESVLIDDQQKVCSVFSNLGGIAKLTNDLEETQGIVNLL